MSRPKQLFVGVVSLCLATAIWLPFVHIFFRTSPRTFHACAAISPDSFKGVLLE